MECEDCGSIISRDESYYVEGGDRYVCYNCLDDNYSSCSRCDEYFLSEDMTEVGGQLYCPDCLEHLIDDGHILECERCGSYVMADDGRYNRDDAFICFDCWDDDEDEESEYIDNYHDSRSPVFKSLNSETSHPLGKNTYIGVEHELSNVGEDNDSLAETLVEEYGRKCEHDSSINYGFECISDPLTFLYWKEREDIEGYMKECVNHGLEPDISSGIHVHISRNNGLDDNSCVRIIEFVFSNFAKCLKFGRRNPKNTIYCEYLDLSKHSGELLWECQRTRYRAVNLEHSSNLELRFFNTTDSASHFWAIIEFAHCLAEVSKEDVKITWEVLRDYAVKDGKCEHFIEELDNDFDCEEVKGRDYDIEYIESSRY